MEFQIYKYVDDLTVLELVLLTGLLTEYNFKQHIASDVGIDEFYVPATTLSTQNKINRIADWTTANQMKLNEDQSNYMVFSLSSTGFATRLTMNGNTLNRVEEV